MALAPIGVRSPYTRLVSGTVGQTARADVFIWNSPDSIPSTPTIVLSKPIPSSTVNTVYFDVSDFCRDFISNTLFSSSSLDTAADVEGYCYLKVITYLDDVLYQTSVDLICFDGYTEYLEGSNSQLQRVLLNEGTYNVSDSGDLGNITVLNGGVETWDIEYKPLFAETPLLSHTIVEEVSESPYIHPNYIGTGGNRVTILKGGVIYKEYTFNEVCEPKYEVHLCDFINKQGAWQRVTFFKVSKSSFSVTDKEYKLMPQTLPYVVGENRTQRFNINGKESIKVNTGWVNESFSEVMKQLMLSETIRLDGLPVNITTKSSPMKKGINDKNISYEVGFMYSFDTINNIQ